MPVIAPKKSSKKKGRWGQFKDDFRKDAENIGKFGKDFAKDAEDIATGIPSGVVMIDKALNEALPGRKAKVIRINGKDVRVEGSEWQWGGNFEPLETIGKEMWKQTKSDLRHPLRNPASTALTVGGILSLGTGTAARAAAGVGAAGKGAKLGQVAKAVARKPKPPVRTVLSIKKPDPVMGERYKTSSGKWIEKPPARTGRKVYAKRANNNPLVRGVRKVTLDPLYEKSAAKATKVAASPRLVEGAKVLKHGSAEYKKILGKAKKPRGMKKAVRRAGYDAISRSGRTQVVNKNALFPRQPRSGGYARFVERRTTDQRKRYSKQVDAALNPKQEKVVPDNLPRNVMRALPDIMRMGMYVRPRYYAQNLAGTASLLAHAGVSTKDVQAVRGIAKSDPELYAILKAAGGETGTTSISMGTTGGGWIGKAQQKAAHLANKPEAQMRTVAIYKAAKDFGVTNPAELKAILSKPDSNAAQLIMEHGNEMVVDYSRYGGSSNFGDMERRFVSSGLPIFYPMTKGFSRYAGRFPTEHPVQAGLLGALGQQGKDFQREGLGGEPQPWNPYITPMGNGKTLNLQNYWWGSPGADVIRQTAQMAPGSLRHSTLNLLQQLGPTSDFATGATSGRQLASGFEYDDKTLDKYGSFLTALGDTANSVTPFADLIKPRTSAAYGTPDLQQRLKLWALGPGLVPRKTNMKKVVQSKKKKKSRGNSRF